LTSLRTKKPRIRISLGEPEPTKKSNKITKRLPSESEEANGEVDNTPVPKKKKQRSGGVSKSESKTPVDDTDKRKGRKRRAKNYSEEAPESEGELQELTTSAKREVKGKHSSESQNGVSRKETSVKRVADVGKGEANAASDDGKKENDSIYLNVAMWKREREALSDKSFKAAREHFQGHGSWSFPSALNDDKFKEVALATLNKMGRYVKVAFFGLDLEACLI
jgi:hypothetical protein